MSKVLIITTGGTIDKEYGDLHRPFVIGKNAVKNILRQINHNLRNRVVTVAEKVSVDITKRDKQQIIKLCKTAKEKDIIITYGTDAIVDFAKELGEVPGKTIVFVGSLKSYEIKNNDAEFNLGFAVAAAQLAEPGTYVAMSARLYPADKVTKDYDKGGKFLELKS